MNNRENEEHNGIEQYLISHSRELKAFAESSASLLVLPFSENVYEEVCNKASEIFGLQLAWLGIIEEGMPVSPVSQSGAVSDADVTHFIWDIELRDEGFSCRAIMAMKPLIINDISLEDTSSGWREAALSLGCRSAIYMPLISSGGRVIGCLNLYGSRPDYFIRDRLEMAGIFCNYVSFVIENRWQIESLERKVRERTTELEHAKIQAEAASKAKSDFLSNMSHELRTPLNSVIGFAEIMEDQFYGPLNEKQKEYIESIERSGKHLLSLINDILDLSKVEAGKMELELGNVSIFELMRNSAIMFKEKAMKHNIKLTVDIAPEAEITIQADERKLKQIIFNLLSNAMKFTPDGGSVSVRARKVTPPFLPLDKGRLGGVSGSLELGVQRSEFEEKENVAERITPNAEHSLNTERRTQDAELNGDFIEISVADTGIGIKEEDMGRLFQEFTQLESAYEKRYAGTGLGLALSKKLVELHHGKILAESEFGKGSRFGFVIPLRQ